MTGVYLDHLTWRETVDRHRLLWPVPSEPGLVVARRGDMRVVTWVAA